MIFDEDLSIPGTFDEKSKVIGKAFIDVHIVAYNLADYYSVLMNTLPIDIS